MSTNNSNAYDKLYDSVNLTADYRFNTYRRLNGLEGASNVALIFSSTALIVVSFIIALYGEKLGKDAIYIIIGQNCLPIIMLALSIMVSGAKYGIRAEKMHECAQILNHFKKNLKCDMQDTDFVLSSSNFKQHTKEYFDIISKYENHSKIDLVIEKFRVKKKCAILNLLSELFTALIGRGILYYFYLSISICSILWIVMAIYLAVKGVASC
ncbi:TPA: SLATT domain-containing protein [Serratia marcescens]|nr:SLATT domain-containing protein [Serratia marcescens]HBH6952992.1 SLATT domain-containing protein [Serratia marcescens]HEJ9148845.1 SLATT domain-containing protein [Serratia marcescens]